MNQYTIVMKIMTAKAAGGNTVTGGTLTGELDITVDGSIDIEQSKTDVELIANCTSEMQKNPQVYKKGKIISLEITDIIEKS